MIMGTQSKLPPKMSGFFIKPGGTMNSIERVIKEECEECMGKRDANDFNCFERGCELEKRDIPPKIRVQRFCAQCAGSEKAAKICRGKFYSTKERCRMFRFKV